MKKMSWSEDDHSTRSDLRSQYGSRASGLSLPTASRHMPRLAIQHLVLKSRVWLGPRLSGRMSLSAGGMKKEGGCSRSPVHACPYTLARRPSSTAPRHRNTWLCCQCNDLEWNWSCSPPRCAWVLLGSGRGGMWVFLLTTSWDFGGMEGHHRQPWWWSLPWMSPSPTALSKPYTAEQGTCGVPCFWKTRGPLRFRTNCTVISTFFFFYFYFFW